MLRVNHVIYLHFLSKSCDTRNSFGSWIIKFFFFFHIPLGLVSLTVAHALLVLVMRFPFYKSSFAAIDDRLVEASFDLGATTPNLFKVILPILMPSLAAAGLLIFILSLDDFFDCFFCGYFCSNIIIIYFAMIRTGVSPEVNALATLMLVSSSALVALFSSLRSNTYMVKSLSGTFIAATLCFLVTALLLFYIFHLL